MDVFTGLDSVSLHFYSYHASCNHEQNNQSKEGQEYSGAIFSNAEEQLVLKASNEAISLAQSLAIEGNVRN